MLKDISRAQLQEAKNHALELVQDIEQLELMLDTRNDSTDECFTFTTMSHSATMNALNCSGLFYDINKQAHQGTALESTMTPEEEEGALKQYRIDEANKILAEYGVK